eukprot:g25690.t1
MLQNPRVLCSPPTHTTSRPMGEPRELFRACRGRNKKLQCVAAKTGPVCRDWQSQQLPCTCLPTPTLWAFTSSANAGAFRFVSSAGSDPGGRRDERIG